MSEAPQDAIRAAIEPVVQDHGLVLEQLELTTRSGARTLCVVVDLPEGTDSLDLDRVADLSRAVSDALDTHDPVPGPPYELEVGTPGATRELREPRHWRRTVGRLVRVRPVAGERFNARLLEVHPDAVVLQRSHQPKKGMPVTLLEPETLTWDAIRSARAEIEG